MTKTFWLLAGTSIATWGCRIIFRLL